MRKESMRVASFDIFDTVLTRRVANPRAVFQLLGRRLQTSGVLNCSSHAFARARTQAEVRAFKNAGGLDSSVCFADIHRELANALHLSPSEEAVVRTAEIELENELLVVIPSGAEMIAEARRAGNQVIFVSDMYLSAAALTHILRDRGLFQCGDKLYVSNEYQRSKSTGSLWRPVIDDIGLDPSVIHHVGNDKRSDGTSAARWGIKSTVLNANNPNRYEEALESHATDTDGLSSCLAGASRIARLAETDPDRQVIADVAAGVVAPFVIGNLLWTLEVAKREGLRELFFVARDGQLLCDVAETLAPKVGYDGKMTYVYGSRQAWSLPAITDSNDLAIDALVPTSGDAPASLATVLARLELVPEEIAQSLERAGFQRDSWSRLLTPLDSSRLRTMIREDEEVAVMVREQAKRSRDLVLSYLSQVGAITSSPIGFVDLGTGATLFNSLSSMLATVGQGPPVGFYFGLRSHLPEFPFGRPLTYVRDEAERTGFLETPGLLTLVELACTADHGSVVGYRDTDDTVEPVLAEGGNAPVVDWGLPTIRETVRRVAEELTLAPDLVGTCSIDLRPAILDVFQLFWGNPTREEAEVWGAYPFEDGWGANAVRYPIAESQKLRRVVRRQPHRHFWQEGAWQLSGPLSRTAFQSRQRVLEVLRKLRNRARPQKVSRP